MSPPSNHQSQLTHNHLKTLEKLAQLSLNDQEHQKYLQALKEIVDMFDLLDRVNTDAVDHLSIQPTQSVTDLRCDTLETANNAEALSKFCPEFNPQTHQIIVPPVIDQSTSS